MNTPGFFEYEINYWDEVDNELATRRGVTYADNLGEAAANLTEYYGEENINDVKFFPLYPEPIYEFNFAENNFKMIELRHS